MREPSDAEAMSPADDAARRSRRAELIKNISKRLRPICSRMPGAEFDAMVQQMADIEVKYAPRSTPPRGKDRPE